MATTSRVGDEGETAIPGWFEVACSGAVVRRAMLFFVVVGGILIVINHGDALLQGDIDGNRLVKMFLTPLVPYMVSTISSVSAIRASARERVAHDRRFHAAAAPSEPDPDPAAPADE